jgi:hypothetical protein
MPHGKSLRAIGQSLESLGIVAFVLEKNGRNYVIRSDSLPDVSALIAKQDVTEKVWDTATVPRKEMQVLNIDGSLEYTPSYISWLDAQGRKKRRKRFSAQASGTMKVSQLLRSLGRHLDRLEPHAFRISWSRDGVCVDYELPDGQCVTEKLTTAKLRELTLRMRFRRARRR